jgi:gas vesicle protein
MIIHKIKHYEIVTSILVGIAIGILIAPDKGSATLRKLTGKLSNFGDDAGDYLSEAADNIKEKAEDIADNVKSKVKKAAGKTKSKAEDLEGNAADI